MSANQRIQPFLMRRASVPPLVDYTTYDLLYSIGRKLNPDYTGWALRLIRDSDSDTEEFSFSGNEIPIASINSWASGTIGRLNELPNQGLAGSTFNVAHYTGTRSIISQSGAVELVNGKPAILGQTGNGYRTSLLAIANTIFDQYHFLSGVMETAGSLNFGQIAGEIGTAAGNNRKGLICDTTTNKSLIDNAVTSASISNTHTLLLQATQNQHRQYSFISFNPSFGASNSRSYWNVNLQQQRNFGVGWGSNTDFYFNMMRYSSFAFLGRFQEFALKTTAGSDDETELRNLELEQNTYYGIY